MKKLGLEIPDYDSNLDPTKTLLPDSIVEWNILKKDLKEIKQKYDKVLRDYKKRKAEEKLKIGAKMPKIKKWKNEDKLTEILNRKSDIKEEESLKEVDLALDDDEDDIFVE